jgi:hypothetical protein
MRISKVFEQLARVADILEDMNRRIGALESDEEGRGYEEAYACRKEIQELKTANETPAAQEPAPEAKEI